MDYSEKQQLVRRIASGRFFGQLNWNNSILFIIVNDPKLDVLVESEWVYKKKYQSLIEDGEIPTLDDTYSLLRETGQWNTNLENEYKEITLDISQLNEQLNKNRFNKTAERAIKKTIDKGKKRLKELDNRKNQLMTTTVEYFSMREKQRFLARKMIKIDDFSLLDDLSFLDYLTVYIFKESSVSDSKLREIARSDPWRLLWNTSKDTGTSLFPHSTVEMTELQQSLVFWTKIYDFAFENMNRPPSDVIEDDHRFDAWLEKESNRLQKEHMSNSIDIPNGGAGYNDVFIVTDREGSKEVFDLNDPMARGRIMSREKTILERGEVREQNLPDIRNSIQMEYNKLSSKGV